VLLDDLKNAIRVRHYSRRTQEAYAGWVKRFILFNGKRHPRDMGPCEVQQFLEYLAVEKRVSASTCELYWRNYNPEDQRKETFF